MVDTPRLRGMPIIHDSTITHTHTRAYVRCYTLTQEAQEEGSDHHARPQGHRDGPQAAIRARRHSVLGFVQQRYKTTCSLAS